MSRSIKVRRYTKASHPKVKDDLKLFNRTFLVPKPADPKKMMRIPMGAE